MTSPQQQALQPLFELQGLHDSATLLSFLNLAERGADTLILHLGSDSIKFGLASQQVPFIAPNVIAHSRKDGKKVYEGPDMDREVQRQNKFDFELERALPEIEHALRKKRFLLIDAKSAKSIRNKQVSFKVFDDTNAVNEFNEVGEDSFYISEQSILQSEIHPNLEKFAFINLPETQSPNTQERPQYFVGREALALHKSEEYRLRYPIRYGDLNVSEKYNIHQCIEDLQTILEVTIKKYMRLPKRNLEQFNCILVIPDVFVKHHLRQVVHMLLAKLKFKSLFIHTESIMATYAMAMSSACVVDIGATKINICCIEDGILVTKSIIRKHYGGDDLNEMLYRLINRNKGLHYFPRFSLFPDYHYHKIMIEYIKENFTLTEMDIGEVVKTCQIKVKDKLNQRHRKCQQITFNCSDALLLAPQSLFYSNLIGILQQVIEETQDPHSKKLRGDPLIVAESFQDPEDLMFDIMQGINQAQSNPQGILKTGASFPNKAGDETPGGTPSASIQQDLQSEIGDGDQTGDINVEKFVSKYQKMQEPMDLDEMICRSICSIENGDSRKKLANSIIVIGGVAKTRKFTDSLEEAVMDRLTQGFDKEIERVNVELYNVQQYQQFLQQQAFLKQSGQAVQDIVPEHLRIDPRFVSWVGASIIPKLDSTRDMFIQREKFVIDFKPYKENFQEQKSLMIQSTLEQLRQEQEEKKLAEELERPTQLGDPMMGLPIRENPEIVLNAAQIENIEKEVSKRLKKERVFEAGMKQVREKAPFHL